MVFCFCHKLPNNTGFPFFISISYQSHKLTKEALPRLTALTRGRPGRGKVRILHISENHRSPYLAFTRETTSAAW